MVSRYTGAVLATLLFSATATAANNDRACNFVFLTPTPSLHIVTVDGGRLLWNGEQIDRATFSARLIRLSKMDAPKAALYFEVKNDTRNVSATLLSEIRQQGLLVDMNCLTGIAY